MRRKSDLGIETIFLYGTNVTHVFLRDITSLGDHRGRDKKDKLQNQKLQQQQQQP